MKKQEMIPYEKRSLLQKILDRLNRVDTSGLEQFYQNMMQEQLIDIIPERFREEGAIPARVASDYMNHLEFSEYGVQHEYQEDDKNCIVKIEQEVLHDYDMSYPITHVVVRRGEEITKATTFTGTELLQIIMATRVNHGEEAYEQLMKVAADKLESAPSVGRDLDSNLGQIGNEIVAMRLLKSSKIFREARKEFDKLYSQKRKYDKKKRYEDVLTEETETVESEEKEFRTKMEVPKQDLGKQQNLGKSQGISENEEVKDKQDQDNERYDE